MMLCAVCTVHKETRSACFLVQPQNQGRRVSWFRPQNWQLRFGDLAHKITTTVSWFGPQNQAGYRLSVALQNRWEDEDGMRQVSRSSDLLLLESSQTRVSQSSLKTSRGVVIDVSYVAPQAHGIINVALHMEYSLGTVFIFSQGRKDLYHV
jgi:hypothetical protein